MPSRESSRIVSQSALAVARFLRALKPEDTRSFKDGDFDYIFTRPIQRLQPPHAAQS
jgi:hypothetical protein